MIWIFNSKPPICSIFFLIKGIKPWCSTRVNPSTREHITRNNFYGECEASSCFKSEMIKDPFTPRSGSLEMIRTDTAQDSSKSLLKDNLICFQK